ncbi:hypothetical protein HRH59_19120 [Rheinheimera sp. YQF-2]|uniref:Uncharacterized protein n=1 Tax=Rheinheimera lutimaris TaxID=2740584 RepID=A0A7Y5AU85_9GAMM|nr:hypothetical protein [Rheinheimera lutimaris]NRQ44647.1 hypothetical protein [Rheinheimera lutimaris]
MNENRFTWNAFWIRQIKVYVQLVPIVYLFWYGVDVSNMMGNLFNWSTEGYGLPKQRWFRVIACGFFAGGGIITLMDLISTWHYVKNPDEIPKDGNK